MALTLWLNRLHLSFPLPRHAHRPAILHVGIVLAGLTFIFALYALIIFLRRAHGLRVRSTDAPYDDRFGPTMVSGIMCLALVANAYVSLTRGGTEEVADVTPLQPHS